MTALTTTVPADDLDLFAGLNDRARKLVQRRLRAMRLIENSPSTWSGCQTIAAMYPGERGWSAKSLHRLYTDFVQNDGNWRTLVDASIAGALWQNHSTPFGLPDAFLDYLAQLWGRRQRDKFMPAYQKLILQYRRWRAGDESAAIPGYPQCPEPDSLSDDDLPFGWTYSNLKSALNKRVSNYARKLIQIGPKSASNLGPQIPTTRCGAQVGQYYILDDSWNDFKVLAYGQSCRLLAFHVLDLFSGCNIARGYKPALKDQETKIVERLREQEMIWLLVSFLTTSGYRPSGTTIICEKSTATVRKREREILATTLGDAITVQDGPSGGGPGISALFTGPGGGNPRWKAPLESWFNLLRNRTDDLLEFPGQTGSNSRLNQPEGLPGLEKDNLALIKAARCMDPEKAELLRLGMLSHHEAIFRLDAITEVINCRTDHSLEAWRECGHLTTEWRLNRQMPWRPAAALLDFEPAERDAIAAVLSTPQPDSLLKRERSLSPREVFDAGKSELVKLPLAVAALLMDDLPGVERPVKNNQIEIGVPEVDPDEPLVFGLTRRNGRGVQDPLRNDEKWLVRVNPLAPHICYLFTADNQFAGVAPYYGRVRRDDPAALQQAFKRKTQALSPLISEARRLAAPITQAATDRAAANSALLGPTPDKRRAEKQRALTSETARESLMKSLL